MAEDNNGHRHQSRAPCHNLSSARHHRALSYMFDVDVKILKTQDYLHLYSIILFYSINAIGSDLTCVLTYNHCFILFIQTMFKIIKFIFSPLDGNSVPNIILGKDYSKEQNGMKKVLHNFCRAKMC